MTASRAHKLNVVVAAQNARSTIAGCLDALLAQRGTGEVRIIVADNSRDGTATFVRDSYPDVVVVDVPGNALVPALWANGMAHLDDDEELVAFTTANMVAEPDWAATFIEAHASGQWAGVGGLILPGHGLGARDMAVYWLRYHRYAAGPPLGSVKDIPGDNSSYCLNALAPYAERIHREGFWEFEINQQLVAARRQLCHTRATLHYAGGESFGDFARQRLVHGRRFGAKRVAGLVGAQRWVFIAAWPLTPLVFLWRIVSEARRSSYRTTLLMALPPLLCLLWSWSIGELQGYLQGERSEAGG